MTRPSRRDSEDAMKIVLVPPDAVSVSPRRLRAAPTVRSGSIHPTTCSIPRRPAGSTTSSWTSSSSRRERASTASASTSTTTTPTDSCRRPTSWRPPSPAGRRRRPSSCSATAWPPTIRPCGWPRSSPCSTCSAGRPSGGGLPGRHVDGHELRVRHQPVHPARAVLRGARPGHAGVDAARGVRVQRQVHAGPAT